MRKHRVVTGSKLDMHRHGNANGDVMFWNQKVGINECFLCIM